MSPLLLLTALVITVHSAAFRYACAAPYEATRNMALHGDYCYYRHHSGQDRVCCSFWLTFGVQWNTDVEHARSWCKENWHPASDLISVHSNTDRNWLDALDSSRRYFVGLHRESAGRVWFDGTPLTITIPWATVDGNANCATVQGGDYDQTDCDNYNGFICGLPTGLEANDDPQYDVSNVICDNDYNCYCDFTHRTCPPAYDGWCNGTSRLLNASCSNHGECRWHPVDKSPDGFCRCDPNYSGKWCQSWLCHGYANSDSKVCGGNGDCEAFQTCVCDSWHDGASCEDWYCDGHHYLSSDACNGNGTCMDGSPSFCDCNDRHYGEFCELDYRCGAYYWHDESVCSGHGECRGSGSTNVSRCDCGVGWTGDDCDTHTCNYIASDRMGVVCAGHGTCLDVDDCFCDFQWTGLWCQTKISCWSLPFDHSSVCSSRGDCVDLDVCQCYEHWNGSKCETHNCFGILHDDNLNVCSGFGDCLDGTPPACSCEDGIHYGDECEFTYVCNGTESGQPGVCNDHGLCLDADDNCICETGYRGEFCEKLLCNYVDSEDPAVCHSHGECVDVNTCNCSSFYTGKWCGQKISCGGYYFDSSDVCSGRGSCLAQDDCTCDETYFDGTICEDHLCGGVPFHLTATVCNGNGTCLDGYPPVCVCDEHHYGADCESPVVCGGYLYSDGRACSGNGDCLQTDDNCVCDPNWVGDNCEFPTCNSIPANRPLEACSGVGVCLGVDNCNCSAGYYGGHCQNKVSCSGRTFDHPDVCSRRGDCVDINLCQCDGSWLKGAQCEETWCGTYASSDIGFVCSGNGVCVDDFPNPSYCECDDWHTGADCELNYTCAAIPQGDPTVCSSHGECRFADDNCICDLGYGNDDCQDFTCLGIPASITTQVCSGRGTCSTTDVCLCEPVVTGQWCTTKSYCWEHVFDSPLACSARGTCIGSNDCSCLPGYGGEQCQISMCYGITVDNPDDACSTHGRCYDVNKCSCQQKYYGEACAEHLSLVTVLMEGMTTDESYEIEIPYDSYLLTLSPFGGLIEIIPDSERPYGESFDCYDRALSTETEALLGRNLTCVWNVNTTNITEDWSSVEHLYVNASKIDVVRASGSIVSLTLKISRAMGSDYPIFTDEQVDFNLNLLRPTVEEPHAGIRVLVHLKEPDEPGSFLNYIPVIGIAAGAACICCVVLIVIFICCICVAKIQKKRRLAEELLRKQQKDLSEVRAAFFDDALRLQNRMRSLRLLGDIGYLPTEFVRLDSLGPESEFQIVETSPLDFMWRKTRLYLAGWQHVGVTMKKIAVHSKKVQGNDVYELIERARAISKLALKNPCLRRYFAYYLETSGKEEEKDEAPVVAVLPMEVELDDFDLGLDFGDEKEEVVNRPKPRMAAVIMERMQENVIDMLRRLADGSAMSGVPVDVKLSWLLNIARSFDCLHRNGLTAPHTTIHSVFVNQADVEGSVKMDFVSFMPKRADRALFCAPEIVSKEMEEVGIYVDELLIGLELDDIFDERDEFDKLMLADVYTFGMIAYCIFEEKKRPYYGRRPPILSEGLGAAAVRDPNFRPLYQNCPSWAVNFIRQCLTDDLEARPTFENVLTLLETLKNLYDTVGGMSLLESEASSMASEEFSDDDLDGTGTKAKENYEVGQVPPDFEALVGPQWPFTESIPFDDVHVEEHLARGEASEVLRVSFESKAYALKVTRVDRRALEESYADVLSQMKLLRSFKHPNFIQIRGLVMSRMQIGVLMEYCPYNVKSYSETEVEGRAQLSVVSRLRILRAIARSIQLLHRNEVQHQSLSANNVMLTEDLVPKLIGFKPRVDRATSGGSSEMTYVFAHDQPQYLAPEATLSSRRLMSLVFSSFGILLYEVMTLDFDPYNVGEKGEGYVVELKVALTPDFRPSFEGTICKDPFLSFAFDWFVALAQCCWQAVPEARPHFDEIVQTFDENYPILVEAYASMGSKAREFKKAEKPVRQQEISFEITSSTDSDG